MTQPRLRRMIRKSSPARDTPALRAGREARPVFEYLIEHRPADGGAWRMIDSASSKARALEAMLSAEGLILMRQGDLVRVQLGNVTLGLAVMTLRRGIVRAPQVPRVAVATDASVNWLSAWEGPHAMADRMLRVTSYVRRQLIVLAAVNIAKTSMLSAYNPDAMRAALGMIEGWLNDEVPIAALRDVENSVIDEVSSTSINSRPALFAALSVRSAVRSVRASSDIAAANWARNAAQQTSISTSESTGNEGLRARDAVLRALSAQVRSAIPLSVELLGRLGENPPFLYVRQNPRKRRP